MWIDRPSRVSARRGSGDRIITAGLRQNESPSQPPAPINPPAVPAEPGPGGQKGDKSNY